MTNKKIRLPLFLAASFLLVGCSSDTIVARPTGWINDKIFVEAGDKDNKMKQIYDAVKNLGDTNSSVLNTVMYKIAKTHIGKFEKDNEKDTDLTLRDIYKNSKDDSEYYRNSKFKQFVESHPKYKAEDYSVSYDDESKTTTKVKIEGDEKYRLSLEKIKNQYNEIVENIYEKLYDEIKGGSYSVGDLKLYSEKEFFRHLKKELYYTKEEEPADFLTERAFFPKANNDETETWKKYVNAESATSKTGYLQVVNEQDEPTGIYDNYIKNKILPELYKTYLTQTYVKEQRTSSLGRSYARKVNMIAIPKGDYAEKVVNMLKYFAMKNITGENLGDIKVSYDFNLLNKAMSGFVGVDDSEEVYALLTNTPKAKTNFNRIKLTDNSTEIRWQCFTNNDGTPSYDEDTLKPTGPTTHVFKGTKLGDLVDKYKLAYTLVANGSTKDDERNFKPIAKKDDEAIKAYNELTNNGDYSIAVGMAIKEKEARLTDMTKEGWFLKNGGLTDLDSKFRDHLFSIKTSTIIDDVARKGDLNKYIGSGDAVRYLGEGVEVKEKKDLDARKAFLTTDTTTDVNPYDSIVLIGSTNVYIVEVKEAVNTSKMSSASNDKSYYEYKAESDAVKTAAAIDKITSEVVKANSTSDTYKKNANEYYLMISNIIFYDQSVYDYFKSQFPDLFK